MGLDTQEKRDQFLRWIGEGPDPEEVLFITRLSDTTEPERELLERVRALEKRVAELEGKRPRSHYDIDPGFGVPVPPPKYEVPKTTEPQFMPEWKDSTSYPTVYSSTPDWMMRGNGTV